MAARTWDGATFPDEQAAPEALAKGAIRVSLGYATSDGDVGMILKAWGKLSESLYKAGNQQEIAA